MNGTWYVLDDQLRAHCPKCGDLWRLQPSMFLLGGRSQGRIACAACSWEDWILLEEFGVDERDLVDYDPIMD